jgi:DNA-binding transcriptional ArsR family regulator
MARIFTLSGLISSSPKIFSKKFAQPINCIYICNQSIAHYMRRDIYQAIADPTRRAILTLLVTGAMTPNAIAEHFDSSRQAVSKHIQILAECGALTQKQQGREIYYHLEVSKMKEVDQWIAAFRQMWIDRFDQLDNLLDTL